MKHLLLCYITISFTLYSAQAQLKAVLISDINPGVAGSVPFNFVEVNGLVYFTADDGEHGRELWKSDGVTAQLVQDINPGASEGVPAFTKILHDTSSLYFVATDGIHGYEPWKLDISTGRASMLLDINPGEANSINNPTVTAVKGVETNFFFTADDGEGFELWKSDGTPSGTKNVKKINTQRAKAYGSVTEYITAIDEKVYFSATDEINGTELWVSDGTPEGTKMHDINPLPMYDGADYKEGESSDPKDLINVNGILYFSAKGPDYKGNEDIATGYELWKFDPIANSASMVMDINSGYKSSFPSKFTVSGNYLYFSAENGLNGTELWKTNLTGNDTSLVMDIASGSADSSPSQLTDFKNTLYFVCDDLEHGRELWTTDGSPLGTHIVADINPGPGQSYIDSIVNINNYSLYFSALDPSIGQELRETNGLAGDLVAVDINKGVSGSYAFGFINVKGKIYMNATTSAFGSELMELSGTNLSTAFFANTPAVTLWPIPSNDIVHIQSDQPLSGVPYTIINLLGQKTREGILNSNELNTSQLNPGIYLIQIDKYKPLKFIKN